MEPLFKPSSRCCIDEVLSMSTPDTDYRWLGIDVSKDHLDVYVLSQPVSTRYENDCEGIEELW